MSERLGSRRGRTTIRRCAALGAPVAVLVAMGVLSASPASAASTDGGLWHLDEPAGSTIAADGSGWGNNGLIRGNVVPGQPGYQNTAYLFDGGWIEVPDSDSLDPGLRDFTASAYVKLIRVPFSGETFDIIRKGTAGVKGGEFKLEIATGGKVRCIAQGITPSGSRITGRIVTPKISLADGNWHYVACSRTGSTWTAQGDGIIRSKTVALDSISNVKTLAIGSKYGQEDFTRGLIDEVRLAFPGA